MTDPAIAKVDALTAFHARCVAHAWLVGIGEFDLHDAVDGLQVDAEATGLVDELGQDFIQSILVDAFAQVPGHL
jgi:hypothetical protein